MNWICKNIVLFIALVVLSWSCTTTAEVSLDKGTTQLQSIDTLQLLKLLQDEVVKNIQLRHIAPPKIDDQFSTILFSNWIERVDPDKIFLFEDEMKALGTSIYKLDDQLINNTLTFFERSHKYLLTGIQRNFDAFTELEDSNFDFSVKEEYVIASNYNSYLKTEEEQRLRYRRFAKYRILDLFNGFLEEATRENRYESISKDSLLVLAKNEFCNLEKGKFKLLSIKDKINYFEDYLDAIVSSFDPYCDYYSEVEKLDYDVLLTGKVVGVGVFIENTHGQNRVGQIAQGGPVWRTNKVEVGDIILGATSQSGEYTEFENATVIEVASNLRGKIGTHLTVHFLGKDSVRKDVKIFRDEFISYGDYVKGLILSKEVNTNVGYINIKKFYNAESFGLYTSSADDVKSYLKYFEELEIESLVIDLRDCIGGVLAESLDIVGALVGEGPLLQSRDRKDSIHIYQSNSKKPIYSGNVIVLINQNSASAAEILASTLQDYQRAILIGNKTFGKGTVQTFYNLEENSEVALPKPNKYGWLKYTSSKYYRVNGDATQLVGVTPDIKLPSILDSVAVIESQMKNPILWSQIEPLKFNKYSAYEDKLRTLKILSKIRVTSNSNFKNVKNAAFELIDLYGEQSVPLNISEYRDYEFLRTTKLRNISNASYHDKPLLEVTTASINTNLSVTAEESRWMALCAQDIYLNETINVLNDLAELR